MMQPIGTQPQHMNPGMQMQQGFAPVGGREAMYAAPPPPQQHTTVVVNQPTATNRMQVAGRDWGTNLCSCCDDVLGCCLAWCCPWCFSCYIACRLDEACCVPVFVPGGEVAMRTKLRTEAGIRGSICNDCFTLYLCYCCALAQMGREITATRPRGGRVI